MEPIIIVENLKRDYVTKIGLIRQQKKRVEALKGVSFTINKGEIFGLLGPNGAGKSTTIKVLTTLLAPTSGTVKVLGYDVFGQESHIRPRINFIFGGERNLYWRLSAEDNLKYFADLYKIPRKEQGPLLDKLFKLVDLDEVRLHKVESYSKGMKQRLQIARALLNDPEIIFLDEPSIGLDPVGARALKQIIRDLAAAGKTILLTTHYMNEAEELCDRIAIINKGEVVAIDTIEGLKSQIDQPIKLRLSVDRFTEKEIEKLRGFKTVEKLVIQAKNNFFDIHSNQIEHLLGNVIDTFGRDKIKGMQILDANLEDVYVEMIGGTHAG
jgi:ABC-2 type transport system ATP-binding protein